MQTHSEMRVLAPPPVPIFLPSIFLSFSAPSGRYFAWRGYLLLAIYPARAHHRSHGPVLIHKGTAGNTLNQEAPGTITELP